MMKSRTQFLIIGLTAVALLTIDVALRTMQLRGGMSGTVVTAREFRLVDHDGNRRAVMSTDENGEPAILLYDQTGSLRAQLDTMQSTPSLILFGPNREQRRVYFGMDDEGDGILEMYGLSGETKALMTSTGGQGRITTDTDARRLTINGGGRGNITCPEGVLDLR